MDKKPLEVKSYNVEDERRFKDLTARLKALEEWQGHAQADIRATERRADQDGDLQERVVALATQRWYAEYAARVAALEAQTVDLQQRVGVLEETGAQPLREHIRRVRAAAVDPPEVRYAPVDDRRGKERPAKPAPMMVCELAEMCVQPHCHSRVPHPRRDNCELSCCVSDDGGGHCIPVPTSPEVAIPATPEPVGTEAFRREMTGHMQTLAQAYSWDADSLPVWGGHDYLKRLAGVACAIRDAYDLARTGEHQAAQEKLEEIEW